MTYLWHHNFCEVAIITGRNVFRITVASVREPISLPACVFNYLLATKFSFTVRVPPLGKCGPDRSALPPSLCYCLSGCTTVSDCNVSVEFMHNVCHRTPVAAEISSACHVLRLEACNTLLQTTVTALPGRRSVSTISGVDDALNAPLLILHFPTEHPQVRMTDADSDVPAVVKTCRK